jgi:hypothetical protein
MVEGRASDAQTLIINASDYSGLYCWHQILDVALAGNAAAVLIVSPDGNNLYTMDEPSFVLTPISVFMIGADCAAAMLVCARCLSTPLLFCSVAVPRPLPCLLHSC